MSKAHSAEEAEIPAMKMKQAEGKPEHKMPGLSDTLPEGMKKPMDKGDDDHHMDGVHKGKDGHIGNAGMGSAVKLLNEHTERGEHAPMVGGHKMHGHSGKLMKE